VVGLRIQETAIGALTFSILDQRAPGSGLAVLLSTWHTMKSLDWQKRESISKQHYLRLRWHGIR
jgi:hypothetical protein